MSATSIRPMGALNLFQAAPAVAQAQAETAIAAGVEATTTERAPRKRSSIWLNIGPMTTTKDAEGNEVQDQVSMPINLAIDTMRKREYPWNFDAQGRARKHTKPLTKGQLEMKDSIDASNLMLDMLLEAASHMEPGTSNVLNRFAVVLQRNFGEDDAEAVDQNAEPDADSKTAQISSMFTTLPSNT
jgi:hypothetical protein